MTRGTCKWRGRATWRLRAVVLVRENAANAIEIRYRGRLMHWSEIPALVGRPTPVPSPAMPPSVARPSGTPARRPVGRPSLAPGCDGSLHVPATRQRPAGVGASTAMTRLWTLIGIGGHLAMSPLPHHRAYGSVPRRFGRLSVTVRGTADRASRSTRRGAPSKAPR